jgi:hypothetical protein
MEGTMTLLFKVDRPTVGTFSIGILNTDKTIEMYHSSFSIICFLKKKNVEKVLSDLDLDRLCDEL